MSVSYNPENRTLKLDTANSSYIIEIFEENYLLHLYYGKKIPDDNVTQLRYHGSFASFSPDNANVTTPGFSPDMAPMEYPTEGAGDFRISALAVRNASGNDVTDIRYVSHKIYPGKPAVPGLPSLYAAEDEVTTLEILTRDAVTGIEVTLFYSVFERLSAMTRSVKVKNPTADCVHLERVYSLCAEFPSMDYNMLDLYGKWGKERTLQTRELAHGLQGVSSKRGSSSHNHNPFTALTAKDSSEEYGDAYGFNLIYSGNFSADIEVDAAGSTRLLMGINPEGFEWQLESGESFYSPEAVLVYSDCGAGGMSREFHRLYRKHLIRGEWRDKKRPLLINSWEAAFFDFDTDKLVSFAEEAQKLGIEMLVMDDGWFGKRDDDTTSLGDWFVNENKLKGGLAPLIERINALGMKFGIWYEPEMISPDSDLFRAHPDWCIHVPGRENCIARHQYVLDMSRKDVRDNIFEQMSSVLSKYQIDYLKWDFNRNITEAGSAILPPERQKELFHRFVLGTYELMGRLTEAFPHLLIENCSGGGGRFDPGMLAFSPQIWCSDNTDPIERLTIQFGTSMCYPSLTMGAHVSANRRTGIETRGNVALWGTFGYELDPNKLTDTERHYVKKQVAEYNKYYSLIHNGDLYRLTPPTDDNFRCAWEFVSENKSEALLTCVTMRRPESPLHVRRLKGLIPDAVYIDDDTDEEYSGALLMNAGINLTGYAEKDGESIKKYFYKK